MTIFPINLKLILSYVDIIDNENYITYLAGLGYFTKSKVLINIEIWEKRVYSKLNKIIKNKNIKLKC